MSWQHTLTTAQAIREILLSLALFVGGIWALYRYWYLERKEAQVELERLKSRIGQTSCLNISVVCTVRETDEAFDLIGDVRINNPGTTALLFDVTQTPPIRISRLRLNAQGLYEVSADVLELGFLSTEVLGTCDVESEGNASMKFVARLPGPEIYLVEFWSRIEIDRMKEFPHTSWMSSVIVEVSAEAAMMGRCTVSSGTPPAGAAPA